MIKIKNWEKFQHFKDRNPPWIKLYRKLLDDPEWHALPDLAIRVLVMVWMVASDNKEGNLPNIRGLAFRLRMTEQKLREGLGHLGHWLEGDDIKMISTRHHDDIPETETERETERETETDARVNNNINSFKPPSINHTTRAVAVPPKRTPVVETGPHMDFIEKFRRTYEAQVPEPFRASKKATEIAKQLVDRYGLDAVERKAIILCEMCRERKVWFTQDGWADFTIEKISTQWNSIIADAKEDPAEKKKREDLEALKKVREQNERTNDTIGRQRPHTHR